MEYLNRLKSTIYSLIIAVIFSCGGVEGKQDQQITAQEGLNLNTIENPVLKEDFADPSVVCVSKDFWATATSSEWGPLYPYYILKISKNGMFQSMISLYNPFILTFKTDAPDGAA
ncbi:hypothetical protein RM553_11955 [Zunongwangia sp. F363]|uniref:Uncharacterized protein n=1 Tax=Autumnicola tepida TaxID=3075595 RepID=A0ABU3CB31_9FLAO|nr:hypothetical protein [Zunongwangia sp. F363]MDT0643547.1 hypothetical protein [Zunongwangia sp. F363]